MDFDAGMEAIREAERRAWNDDRIVRPDADAVKAFAMNVVNALAEEYEIDIDQRQVKNDDLDVFVVKCAEHLLDGGYGHASSR